MLANRESSDIESSSQHICWQFFLNNCSLLRSVSSLKVDFFLLSYQVSCYFAAVEVDAKNVTRSVVAWNNRTNSAYSDVSDQVF